MVKIINDSKEFKDRLPIFATKEFLELKSNDYAWFVDEDFILPFYIDKRAIFSKLTFTTATIMLNDTGNEKKFLNEVVKKAKVLDIDYISQPLANAVFSEVADNSTYIDWGSYVVSLALSEEEILKNMHSKHRNVIKKAIKDGVLIEETKDANIVFENLKETMQRQNRAYPSFDELEKLKKISKFYIAKKDDIVQGCAVLPYNRFGALYLYGGSISRPYTGSLNLMHYRAMCDLKKLAVAEYDFMGARLNVEKGTKLEGIQRFKSRFGGELKRGFLWKYNYKPLKIKAIEQIQKIRFRLKGMEYMGDAIEQELKRCKK